MRITYDPEVGALYIRLLEGEHQCRTLRLTDEVSLNIGEGEALVGIESWTPRKFWARAYCRQLSSRTFLLSRPEHNS
jgi:uncharacterized protein YuzE